MKTLHIMHNIQCLCADSCSKKCSTANRGPLSEARYDLLVAAVLGNPDQIPEVDDFIKQNTSYIYSGGCETKPNFCYGEESGTLYRLTGKGSSTCQQSSGELLRIFTVHKAKHVGKMGSMQL